jgi:O-antigen/teichoic acid export membrane protein
MPHELVANNRRIAKNTIYLYIRMLVTLIVSLYTSRLILRELGVEDFGIYNIIGGVIVLFSFLNTAMTEASQRFISFELGRGNHNVLNKTFCMSMTCHLVIAIALLLIAETFGLWIINTKLNIPIERLTAAKWVYQFSIFTFIMGILRVPYNASIISYEKMSFYSFASILEVVLKLIMVFALSVSPIDVLILYSALIFVVSVISWFIYYLYCRAKIPICKYRIFWDSKLYNKLMGFSGWSMLGGSSVIASQQGGNILINLFSGVAANAAYGISSQVSSSIYGFVSNFQMAFQPQIVKLFADGSYEEENKLIIRSSKLSYFLLLIIFVPFIINSDYVLKLWLYQVPEYTTIFCTLMLLYLLIDAIQAPLWMAIGATGNIKRYQIWLSAILLLNIPISYYALKIGYSPSIVLIIRVVLNFLTAIIRVLYVKSLFRFPYKQYLRMVFYKAIPVTLCSVLLSYIIKQIIPFSLLFFIIETVTALLITVFLVYYWGLTNNERNFVKSLFFSKYISQ